MNKLGFLSFLVEQEDPKQIKTKKKSIIQKILSYIETKTLAIVVNLFKRLLRKVVNFFLYF